MMTFKIISETNNAPIGSKIGSLMAKDVGDKQSLSMDKLE